MLTNYLPDINQVLLAVLQFIIAAVLGFVMRWLKTHTTAKQRDVLHRVAEEAFSFAQTVYAEHDGPAKLAAAMAYLSSRLKAEGINVTPDEMRAAIEKAYLAYQAATTQPGTPDPVTLPAQLPAELQQFAAAASAFVTTMNATIATDGPVGPVQLTATVAEPTAADPQATPAATQSA